MITFTLTDEEWQQFLQMQINMMMNANPVMQKMLQQAQAAQQQAAQAPRPENRPTETKTPEVVRMPSSTEQRERTR